MSKQRHCPHPLMAHASMCGKGGMFSVQMISNTTVMMPCGLQMPSIRCSPHLGWVS